MNALRVFLRRNRPWRWILWHPHQRFYNWALLKAMSILFPFPPVYRRAVRAIIFIDTVILFARALGRRARKAGMTSLVGTWRLPKAVSILYLDLGTHREARELTLMVNEVLPRIADNFDAYGFEAGEELCKQARANFVGRTNVHLIHAALCHVLPSDGKVKLYKDAEGGLENSLYRKHRGEYEEARALRLSDWLRENHFDLRNAVCLLRMNIEGAEFDVIADLVDCGLASCIDGYFGMWDDLSKIDKRRDNEFRAFLAKHRISPFTFNGRDLEFHFRVRCIEYEIGTSVRAGLGRIKKGGDARASRRQS